MTGERGVGDIKGLTFPGVRGVGLGDGKSGDGEGVGVWRGVGVFVGVLNGALRLKLKFDA